jgi:hypothetical protein
VQPGAHVRVQLRPRRRLAVRIGQVPLRAPVAPVLVVPMNHFAARPARALKLLGDVQPVALPAKALVAALHAEQQVAARQQLSTHGGGVAEQSL